MSPYIFMQQPALPCRREVVLLNKRPPAVAVVGYAAPPWLSSLSADTALVSPSAVEPGLNALLERTAAPVLLAIQADDQLEAFGLQAVARVLSRAAPAVAGACGDTEQVRPDGTRQRVEAVHLTAPADALSHPRLPHPVLFRTEALRAVGGWRPGEANWPRCGARHRHLLARLLERGPLLAVHAFVGSMAPPMDEWPPLTQMLRQLMYQPVTVRAGGRLFAGRVAALSLDLLTLAGPGGQVTVVPTDRVEAVSPGMPQPQWP